MTAFPLELVIALAKLSVAECPVVFPNVFVTVSVAAWVTASETLWPHEVATVAFAPTFAPKAPIDAFAPTLPVVEALIPAVCVVLSDEDRPVVLLLDIPVESVVDEPVESVVEDPDESVVEDPVELLSELPVESVVPEVFVTEEFIPC